LLLLFVLVTLASDQFSSMLDLGCNCSLAAVVTAVAAACCRLLLFLLFNTSVIHWLLLYSKL